MNYRSIADLNAAVVAGLRLLPRDIDLVVGVPRSGLLAANVLSLASNIPMTDLDSFLAGRIFSSGFTKRGSGTVRSLAEMRRVLVIDDSIYRGAAMRSARDRIATAGLRADFIYAAVYGTHARHRETDFVFEVVPQPRMFQWNVMHHIALEQSCVDIDGVLCADPTEAENDDGPAYRRFLKEARPLQRPTRKIAYLVTSRLEKYRALTETWLAAQGIEYGRLVMLDVPSKAERQRRSAHGRFKGEFYRDCEALLFIESEAAQAATIAGIAGKPVLCTETQEIVLPEATYEEPVRNGLTSLLASWFRSTGSAPEPVEDNGDGPDESVDEGATDIRYVLIDPDDQARPRTLISHLGASPENLPEVIESIRQVCVSKSEFPVVVLSQFHQELMASMPAPVEFLPERRHVPSLTPDEYAHYVNRRWALLLEKWKIDREVTLAASFDEFLAEQMA